MKKLQILFTSLIMAAAISNVTSAAPVQWSINQGGNGHFYEVIAVPSGITWTQADEQATQKGGYLATITSEDENTFIFSLVDYDQYWNNHAGPWLGGYQQDGSSEPDGGWSWITGEPFEFTAWGPFQPNNKYINENVLHFWDEVAPFYDPTWNDVLKDYTGTIAYVVEYVPEPSSFLLLTLTPLILKRKKHN